MKTILATTTAAALLATTEALQIQQQFMLDIEAGAGLPNYNGICKELFEYQNQLRTNPKSGISSIEVRENSFTEGGNPKMSVMNGVRTTTNEGKPAVTEFKEFLMSQPATTPLKWNEGMVPGTAVHVKDMVDNGAFSHDGTDGSSPSDRQNRFGVISGAGENIAWAYNPTGKGFAEQFAVDDGVPSRGHRNNMFNPDFNEFACVCDSYNDPASGDRVMVTLNYAQAFASPQDYINNIWGTALKQQLLQAWLKDTSKVPVPADCKSGGCGMGMGWGYSMSSQTKYTKQMYVTYYKPDGGQEMVKYEETRDFAEAGDAPQCGAGNTDCGSGQTCLKSSVKNIQKNSSGFRQSPTSVQSWLDNSKISWACLADEYVPYAKDKANSYIEGVKYDVKEV